MRWTVVLLCLLAVAAYAMALGVPASADDPPYQPPSGPPMPSAQAPTGIKHPKFATSVLRLIEASQAVPDGMPLSADSISYSQPAVGALLSAGLLRLDGLGRAQLYLNVSNDDQGTLAELQSLGVVVERLNESGGLLQATVPIKALPQIADLEYVTAVTLPKYGHVNIGSKLSEGVGLLGLNAMPAGADGSGVTVGVISDGILGLADAIALGDLPATTFNRDGGGKLISTTGGVISASFRADGDLEGGLGEPTGAEGTAILEIVHDIAPGAQLRFANFSTSLEFIAAVDFLTANSDVVIDDIAFFGLAYDQTSPVSANTSDELNRLSNRVRGYYTSVGNEALSHYQELYVDSGTDGTPFVGVSGSFHLFAASGSTTDCYTLGPGIANSMLLAPGDTASIWLTWDDAFGAATTDYDLYVFRNDTGALVASSTDDNVGVTGDPVESVAFTNTTSTSKSYDIFIQNFQNASPPKTFDMFVVRGGSPCPNGSILNYDTVASSVPAQSDAGGGVVSVGAINASDPGTDDIESFSSHGPTNNGAIKPDVAAIDGVSVTGSGGFGSPFFGTSASAPHVAGLAALILDLRPDLLSGEPGDDPAADRATLRAAIVDGAIDLGIAGVDNTFGYGRVNGPASATLVGGFPAEITVTESVSVTEAPGLFPPAQIAVAEALSASESLGVFPPASISVVESVNVADSLGPGMPKVVNLLTSVPALTIWGLLGMALLVGVALVFHLRRRTSHTRPGPSN